MPIIATAGAANANSYVTALEAGAYFESSPNHSRWQAVKGADNGEALLLSAMRFIETLLHRGVRATTTQALEYPRYGGALRSSTQWRSNTVLLDGLGRAWAVAAVPSPVKDAQCEMALALGENSYLDPRYKRKVVKGGSSTVELPTATDLGVLCPASRHLLKPFLLSAEAVPS